MKQARLIDSRVAHERRMKNPKYKTAYEALEDEFTVAKDVIKLRMKANLTQKQLAQKIGTSQPAIARLESGSYTNVSLSFLKRVASALGVTPKISFKRV